METVANSRQDQRKQMMLTQPISKVIFKWPCLRL